MIYVRNKIYIVLKYFDLNGINLIVNNTNPGVNQKEIKDCAIHLCFLIKNTIISA